MSFFQILNAMDMIIIDREFCKDSNEVYGLDHPDILQTILDEYNSFDGMEDGKEKAVLKGTCLLAGLVWGQPFKNGNKRTALAISRVMINENHHRIKDYETEEKQEEVYDLLEKTMLKMEGDPTIKTELESYLRENLIKI